MSSSLDLVRAIRAKREAELKTEKLWIIARKAKLLSEEAFSLEESGIGARLLDAAEYTKWLIRQKREDR